MYDHISMHRYLSLSYACFVNIACKSIIGNNVDTEYGVPSQYYFLQEQLTFEYVYFKPVSYESIPWRVYNSIICTKPAVNAFLLILMWDPTLKNHKATQPTFNFQRRVSSHHRPNSKTPFKWGFPSGGQCWSILFNG